MNIRCFITGGSGFLGSYTVRALIEHGVTVAVLLRGASLPERLHGLEGKLHIIQGDLTDQAKWQPALAAFKPDAIIHMAWRGVAGRDKNDPTQMENVAATLKLAETGKACGIKHFIGAGSQAEYGSINKICRETDSTAPNTIYGKAKLEACVETAKFCKQNGIRFAWLRIFSTYGPGDHDYWVLPYIITELVVGHSPDLTKGEQLWDYLHARDAAEAFAAVLRNEKATGVFNLGSGTAPKLADTVIQVRNLIDPSLKLGFGRIPYGVDQVMHLQADISRLTQLTGWIPAIPLPEGLKETVTWYEARYKNQ